MISVYTYIHNLSHIVKRITEITRFSFRQDKGGKKIRDIVYSLVKQSNEKEEKAKEKETTNNKRNKYLPPFNRIQNT